MSGLLVDPVEAAERIREEVRSGRFPEDQHTYAMPDEELAAFFAAR